MAKITFDNKVAIYDDPLVPANNKISASDVNEIKTVVNTNDDNYVSDAFYSINDEVEVGSTTPANEYVASGYISSGTTKIFIKMDLPKKLDNINTITVDSLEVEARGISGYLNSVSGFIEYVGLSGYTIAAAKSGSNSITIQITKSSAFTNTTNNTPIVLNGKIKLTLT